MWFRVELAFCSGKGVAEQDSILLWQVLINEEDTVSVGQDCFVIDQGASGGNASEKKESAPKEDPPAKEEKSQPKAEPKADQKQNNEKSQSKPPPKQESKAAPPNPPPSKPAGGAKVRQYYTII